MTNLYKNCQNSLTFRLFKKKPSFVGGISSLIDFFGNEERNYRLSKNETEADVNAIYSDWLMVGNDMSESMNHFKTKYERK